MDLQTMRAAPGAGCCSGGHLHQAVHTLRGRPCRATGPFRTAHRYQQSRPCVRMSAEEGDKADAPAAKPAGAPEAERSQTKGKRKYKQQPADKAPAGKTVSLTLRRSQEEAAEAAEAFKLDDINPVAIGKRSRQVRACMAAWAACINVGDLRACLSSPCFIC